MVREFLCSRFYIRSCRVSSRRNTALCKFRKVKLSRMVADLRKPQKFNPVKVKVYMVHYPCSHFLGCQKGVIIIILLFGIWVQRLDQKPQMQIRERLPANWKCHTANKAVPALQPHPGKPAQYDKTTTHWTSQTHFDAVQVVRDKHTWRMAHNYCNLPYTMWCMLTWVSTTEQQLNQHDFYSLAC